MSEWFQQLFRRHCGINIGQVTINSVPQIQADLMYSVTESEILFNEKDLIVMCLMEEEITVRESFLPIDGGYFKANTLETITTYEVMSYDRDRLPSLQGKQIKVLTTGSYDIGENFQRFVETRLADRLAIIASRNGTSAIKVLDELAKVALSDKIQ